MRVAINVSPLQLENPAFTGQVERVVRETAFDWNRLEFEITESAWLTAGEPIVRAMNRLGHRGVSFALDDFGTGYSNLTALRRFSFGKIKIDRTFIEKVDCAVEATLVHAIVSIARTLGLKVVAEGVEDEKQKGFLSAAGVHYLQGYLFAKPMSAADITARLRAARRTVDSRLTVVRGR
jgi:EAL domain-containing protein (putative c-di-GMP-specific phosphodiesterase class I)